MKSYKIETESVEDIQVALAQISADGFTHVIAPFTLTGAEAVIELNPEISIFFPTINKQDTDATSPYLYFGGIDYHAQSDLLLKEAVSPLIIFYDKSAIGKKLALYEEESLDIKLSQRWMQQMNLVAI